MRVAMVGTFGLRPQSTMAVRALPLARVLVRHGHTVRLVLPPWNAPEDGDTRLVTDGVEVINLRVPAAPAVGVPGTVARMLRSLRVFAPEVLHCFKPKGFGGLVAQAAIIAPWLLPDVRRVIVDTDDWEGPGGWNDLGRYSALQRRLFASQEPWLLRRAHAVTAASRYLDRHLATLRSGGHTYLPNAVEAATIPDGPLPDERPGAPTILVYTRFVEFAPERLAVLFAAVRKAIPAARLLVAGAGLAREDDRLRRAAADLGVSEALEMAGWVSPQRLAALAERSTFALFPCDDRIVNRAKSTMKLLDVMALGLPVVAEAVGEFAEVVVDGVTGRLVPPGRDAELVAVMVDLGRNARLAARLGAAGRERIRSLYTWERQVARVEAVYAG